MRRLVNFCWSLFKWAFALALVAALASGGYLYLRLDEEIRRYAQNKLAGHYTGLEVSVGGARFVPGRGVTVFDVSLAQPAHLRPPGGDGRLLEIAELSLVGRFEMTQLIEGEPVIDRVVVRRPRLEARRSAGGRWSFESLLPPPESGGRSPPLEIVDATLVIVDESKPQNQPLTIRNAELKVERKPDAQGRQTGTLVFEGRARDSIAELATISGEFNPSTGAFQFVTGADTLRVDRELLASLPMLPTGPLAELNLEADASFRLNVSRANNAAPLDWNASFSAVGGAIEHEKLPRRLTDLKLVGTCDSRGLSLRSLTAKCGLAEITAACNRHGWSPTATVAARGRVTGLPLDNKLRAALPEMLQKQWRRFLPEGTVDGSGTATFDGVAWRTEATVDCRGISVEDSERFPYRLTDARGVLHYSNGGAPKSGRMDLQLQGVAEGRAVALTADFTGLPCPAEQDHAVPPAPKAPCPVGWVEINAPRLRVTPAMLTALRPHRTASQIAEALSPSGEFSLRWRMERPNEETLDPSIAVDLEAIDIAVEYDKFPYPLEHLRGKLTGRGDVWRFENVESREASGPRVVTSSGMLAPEEGRPTFRMQLTATAAALDETLRQALPEEHQQIWSQLRPEGRVSVTSNVVYTLGDQQPSIALTLAPHQRSVSIEPTFFQYRLSRLDGRFVMTDGQVQFTNARAEHGRSTLTGNGSWVRGADGGWQFRIEGLNVDYLDADHDLRLAAPIELRRVIDALRPEGHFGVHDSRLAFTYDPRRPGDLRSDWDLYLDCHQADVNFGVRVEGVTGGLHLVGVSNGEDCRTYGELNLDSLFWNGLQLTNIRGPLYSDAVECRLGRGVADKHPGAPPVEIAAQAYGGRVTLNARVLHGDRPQYGMSVGLADIDLDRFSRDYLQAETPLTGRAEGRLDLSGRGSSIYGLEGNGAIQVKDANLYELPLAVALLKVLRNRAPDTNAFDGCNAEFTLAGQHLNFSRLDLLGDAVSLYGRGEASLDKDVNLTFHTIVGRYAPAVPLLRSFVGQASEQIMRLRVLGTIDQPDIRREALPVVGNVLEQLRADLQPKTLSQPAEVPKAAALRRQVR